LILVKKLIPKVKIIWNKLHYLYPPVRVKIFFLYIAQRLKRLSKEERQANSSGLVKMKVEDAI